MSVPISQMVAVAAHVLRHKLQGHVRYPLVLMLEPLYRCNLACAGCGKIQYPANILKHQLSVEECMRAADECPTPMVSIPGGEPLLHPDIGAIVGGLVERKKYVYLCTNALLLEEKLPLFTPSKFLSFSVHLDGLQKEHDESVCREGTFEGAYRAIELALARGFRVTTNTTFFEGADPERAARFFDEMMKLGVEGMMVSPGYGYDSAPDQSRFLARERTRDFFRALLSRGRRRWAFNQSPLFLEFLAGARDYDCTPWGMPCYGVFGWQRPCYLLQEGYAEHYRDLLEGTDWRRFGPASGNPKCRDCMVHSGFEASAVDEGFSSLRGLYEMARATLFGPSLERRVRDTAPAESPVLHTEAGASAGSTAPATPDTLRAAFDYRGDVTLRLADGSRIEGYVANLGEKDLRLWRRGSSATQQISIDLVREVRFSGRDSAAGRSWHTWRETHDLAEKCAWEE